MDNTVFCSVAFGKEYVQQQARLRESIRKFYPQANLLFYTEELPPGSRPFLDSLYGFKPHLAQEARKQGYKRIILLDPAMIMVAPLDGVYDRYSVVAAKDTSVLWNVTSHRAADYFGTSRVEIRNKGWHLVGGSFYYFNLETASAVTVLDRWTEAEKAGMFGSQQEAASEQLQGHRYDETIMAICMYQAGIEPQDPDKIGYCVSENSVWQKKHFK